MKNCRLTVFYNIIVNLIAKAIAPPEMATTHQVFRYQEIILTLMRILPGELYTDATTTLLMSSVRSLLNNCCDPLTASLRLRGRKETVLWRLKASRLWVRLAAF